MSMQVLPTAPSPTVTHFMNLEALILLRPVLVLGPGLVVPPPPPATPVARMEKTRTRREMGVFVAGEEEGEGGRGVEIGDAGTNGGKRGGGGRERRGLRREEEAVSAPEWWVGTARSLLAWPGLAVLLLLPSPANKPNKEWMDGWSGWSRGGG